MCEMILHDGLAEQLRSTGELFVAQRAPIAPITLDGQARDVANIPRGATHFTWIYPPAGFTQKTKAVKKNIDKLVTSGDFQSTFLALGGFAYVNGAHDPIRTVQINCLVKADTGLTFDGPFPWKSEFTNCLQRHGRFQVFLFDQHIKVDSIYFQSVTIAELLALGIQYYCFINPNEELIDFLDVDKTWTPALNGAFVYLYNSDMKPHKFDCFFRVADTPAQGKNTGLVQPFSIILNRRSHSRFQCTNSEPLRTISTPNSQDIPEQYLCAICKVETIRCLFMPCRHLCVCSSCAKKLHEDRHTKCPLCNKVFQDIWNVFL